MTWDRAKQLAADHLVDYDLVERPDHPSGRCYRVVCACGYAPAYSATKRDAVGRWVYHVREVAQERSGGPADTGVSLPRVTVAG